MSYEAYRTRMDAVGLTQRERSINDNRQGLINSFSDSPSYYQVESFSPSNPSSPLTLDSWIVDDSKIKELKQIQLIPDQILSPGDIIVWNSQNWLTLNVDNMGGIYYRGSIQRCLSSIKWLDTTGGVQEAWFTYRSDSASNFGVEDGRIMVMPNERRSIIVQSNVYTQQIRKDRRFIFDNRVWKCTSIDGLVLGVITLTLAEELESNVNDNMDLRIADYTNNIPSYTLLILNGTDLSLQAGNTLTLITEVKNRGVVVTDKPLVYTSSNPLIATISNTGVITTVTNGSTVITVKLADNSAVLDSLNLTVQFSTVSNKVVVVLGNSEVLLGDPETYTREIKNNGVVDNTSLVQWFLYADDGVSTTELATLSFISTTQCTIKPNNKAKVGYVKLKCVVTGSPTVFEVKRIRIISLI